MVQTLRFNEMMNPEQAKIKSIIDMAFGFSAMTRVFAEGSKTIIGDKLESILTRISSSGNKQDFRNLHDDFCQWFMQNIKTAERKLKNGKIKPSGNASYGQGAKVLDVALKVYVYYCHLPDPVMAGQTVKWLNTAVDTNMMNHLKRLPNTEVSSITATSIEDVSKKTYHRLQGLVQKDIEHNFQSPILPVQWDDIMWRKLNKRDKPN